jgi:TatA/E family protein of Tat protein translocase
MSFFGMGGMEIMVIMVVALIIFGPGKLPEIGAQVGKAVRDFRRTTNELTREFNDSTSDIRSTMDEMKGTVAQVEQETKELAQSIPATLEGTAATVRANGASVASSAGPAANQPDAAPAPSREDPLADLESLDEEVFSGRSSS